MIPRDFHLNVVRPVLDHLDMGGIHAERLVVGTALVESGLKYLKQIGGPALGVYQIEPATRADIARYLHRRQDLHNLVEYFMTSQSQDQQLITNLAFATCMCRIKYWMSPDKMPDTLEGFATTWKKIYNTPLGAGTEKKFIERASEIMTLGD